MADIVYKLDPEVLIGTDTVNRAGSIVSALGSRALVAAEQVLYENNSIGRLTSVLEDAGVEAILFDEIPAQATADVAENAADLARGARCDVIIGFGGLQTQSIARMAAIIAGSSLEVFDLLDGRKEEKKFIPYIAMPTMGHDPFLFADCFIAVDPRDRSVKLVRSPPGLCVSAIIDGGLSESPGGKLTPTAAFDGFCAAVESYCSSRSNFLSDALLEQSIALYSGMISSYAESSGFDLVSGITSAGFLLALGASISTPGIGTALAYALNGKFPVAKSWCATVLLPYVLERLVTARPEKMAKVAALLGEPVEGASVADSANMAVDSIRRRMGVLKVPARLKEFNLSLDKLAPVAEAARNLEFVAFSPWTVASEDAFDILKQAF
ncbi:iron-containing alcohol dehydrogenase [Leadbettera azotonutricia]|uniref:Putative iron dependent alcohol dehydrogenase n=1 Tax=Leadbettera azotonutricia (strain ATCC BAA-888 / DSM 13862 / ZAS-9) TaxID=545695 RepID=F5YBX6_LEAAZ|nr:iron-containing alcohol dehydrogenase [Leadbettera azotonutricia]AEF82923.1 putative iron dependent alcohol dehydrogenase [Leadbettera azotonutricia ZAS-9]